MRKEMFLGLFIWFFFLLRNEREAAKSTVIWAEQKTVEERERERLFGTDTDKLSSSYFLIHCFILCCYFIRRIYVAVPTVCLKWRGRPKRQEIIGCLASSVICLDQVKTKSFLAVKQQIYSPKLKKIPQLSFISHFLESHFLEQKHNFVVWILTSSFL